MEERHSHHEHGFLKKASVIACATDAASTGARRAYFIIPMSSGMPDDLYLRFLQGSNPLHCLGIASLACPATCPAPNAGRCACGKVRPGQAGWKKRPAISMTQKNEGCHSFLRKPRITSIPMLLGWYSRDMIAALMDQNSIWRII